MTCTINVIPLTYITPLKLRCGTQLHSGARNKELEMAKLLFSAFDTSVPDQL